MPRNVVVYFGKETIRKGYKGVYFIKGILLKTYKGVISKVYENFLRGKIIKLDSLMYLRLAKCQQRKSCQVGFRATNNFGTSLLTEISIVCFGTLTWL